jgi:hypothetical protein
MGGKWNVKTLLQVDIVGSSGISIACGMEACKIRIRLTGRQGLRCRGMREKPDCSRRRVPHCKGATFLVWESKGPELDFLKAVWVMKGHFDMILKSLEEAACIDGAGYAQTMLKIILPLSLPAITFVALSSFITPLMAFILPKIVLRSSEKMTLEQGLYNMVANETNSSFTTFAAGAVLVALPITILYMCFQKYLIHGMTAGADKG